MPNRKKFQQWGRHSQWRALLAALILTVISLHPVWADDTEIYFSSDTSKPNLLFILDASHSMKWWDCDSVTDGVISKVLSKHEPCNDGTVEGQLTRLERMFNAMDQVLDTLPDELNVGIMRFGGWDGGRVIYPVTDLAQPGVRDEIKSVIREINTVLGTPSVGALEEAYRYYAGQPVNHGRIRTVTSQFHSKYFSRVSHPDTYTGGTVAGRGSCQDDDLNNANCENEHIAGNPVYKSPIESECQANHAILLSDGDPNTGHAGGHTIQSYYDTLDYIAALNGGVSCENIRADNRCGEELTAFMRNGDLSDLPGDQNVTTHTIGFNIQSNWMVDVAFAGGGEYLEAASSSDLVNVITDIVSGVSTDAISLVAPTVAIDQFTRLSHREEIYLALFQPRVSPSWVGNLKKYHLNGANPTLKDKNGAVAIDAATGQFLPDSQSFWSASADGGSVRSGGAASNLNMNSRNLYSNLSTGISDLTALTNRINDDNVSNAIIGASDDTERETYIDWLYGLDVRDEDRDGATDDPRHHIGDPLHSTPVVVAYESEGDAAEDSNALVFFGTNEGFIHAIDTEEGTEEYAFMPQELMSNVPQLFGGTPLSTVDEVEIVPVGATQSSTGFSGIAARAIDGNTSGDYYDNSVTHTELESQPWLDIDLGLVSDVTGVTLWNRTDHRPQRLQSFHVLISETPFATDSTLSSNLSDPDIVSYFHPGQLTGNSVDIPLVGTGRYVRIQLQGENYLSLAEVVVSGVPGAPLTLGPLEPAGATQSSTHGSGSAARAIDGNTSGNYGHASTTHTKSESQPWFELDFGAVEDITNIKIWNRTDCCRDRLSDFHVLVSETPFAAGSSLNDNLSKPGVWSSFHAGEPGDTVSVPADTSGRYVRIQLQNTNYLSLAEVEVTGVIASTSDTNTQTVDPVAQAGAGKVYGMDGNLTVRAIDIDNNGFIDHSTSEKAYLYAGMRRGGRSYYALDVSKKDQPEIQWSIIGGTGDFAELGQSWSKPIVAKVKVGTDIKDVLVFAGGYDPLQDSKQQRSPDSMGRAIYMVDADTGQLVWSGGNPDSQPSASNKHYGFADMTYSIPGNLAIVNDQATGYLSQIYVGDMGGRLWRFDVNNESALADLVNGGIIADFGQDGSTAGARRFFASPDLSLAKEDGKLIVNIAIGSGYRAHPLNKTIEDKFFVLQYPYDGHGSEYGVQREDGYSPATLLDLYDTTSNIIAEGTEAQITQANEDLAGKEGWFITMESSGEKILDQSSTYQGIVRFTSYVPATAVDHCATGIGNSFYYAVSLQDGTPFEDINPDVSNPHEKENRKQELPTPGIAPPVSIVFVEHEGAITPTDVVGTTSLHVWEDVSEPVRWFWAEVPD